MKISFLGTNGWYDTNIGNTICTIVETKKEYIILDAGNGFYKIDQYIKKNKPIYLFLSHFHLDHIVGLHILNKFYFPQGINIFGPPGLKKYLRRIIRQPYTLRIDRMKTKIRLNELNGKVNMPLAATFKKLKHSSMCYGFRFNLDERVISYCPDTGVCKNLFFLSKDADLLIIECSYKAGQRDESWPHLNPKDAALVANESGVKLLALTHFTASLYLTLSSRKRAEMLAKKTFKNTFSAKDDMSIVI